MPAVWLPPSGSSFPGGQPGDRSLNVRPASQHLVSPERTRLTVGMMTALPSPRTHNPEGISPGVIRIWDWRERRTAMSIFLQTENPEEMEREVLSQVSQSNSCYVRNSVLDAHLGGTTEEQTVAWRQGFCEREGLSCHPCQEESDPGGVRLGTVFESVLVAGMRQLNRAMI